MLYCLSQIAPQTNQVKIEQIQVHQKQLKKGCARFLMATVIDLAKNNNLHSIFFLIMHHLNFMKNMVFHMLLCLG
ncbi:hypothetical protein DC094_10790 [Pelagibaculum spongiae]|uniref:N-acetyltransferase domain-containing protein n=1 Tax=Pelagibaculum spongiae TaxID=2080658 RepID=A0A2V1GYQ6_9GAMM|nr:hypothetical protein DC094_10790 [Pelagibaculum spongiae]